MNKMKYDKFSCLDIDEKIKCICKFNYRYFFNKANVQGIGFSYKITNGFNTFKKCIQVCVSKKNSKLNIKPKDLIPQYFKGIETDVVESGFFIANSLTKKIRPVPGGYDIGPISEGYGGTYGCLVTDNKDYFLLSNNHVIAGDNTIPIGTPIVQPSVRYGGVNPKNIIAALSKFVPVEPSVHPLYYSNIVDCAIARVGNSNWTSKKIKFLGFIKGINSPTLGQNVQKVGAYSELTKGMITALNFTCIFRDGEKSFHMIDQIQTTQMAYVGDSGALLLDTNMYALGLVVGGADSMCISNYISHVLNSLNVKIVTS